jgi:hypothetical protein
MGAFLFTCPITGMKVHGWASDDKSESPYFEAVECTACGRTHLVETRTGKVAGSDNKARQ